MSIKPSVIAAGLVVALGAAAGVASMGFTRTDEPKIAQRGSDPASKAAPANKNAPGERKVGPAEKADHPDNPGNEADRADRNVHVEAPRTSVDVQKDSGRVRVKAPYTDVKVDPDKGQVRVRAPYVDLNIRW